MDQITHLLTRGVDTIYPNAKALEDVLRAGKKLTLYQGFDPTGPHLHIGHAVALRKLRQFQELGHHVIFLIGDFTATIGDPTGKFSERATLSKEQVIENAKTYKEQAGKILKFDGENPVEIKFNSEWLAKITPGEFLQLAHNLTLQQVIERDMFQKRMQSGQDLFMNEFLYPVLQGYDSVAMDVDLEIGGTDQMFNMMMGRKLMRNIKQKEKFVMTVPLLTDAQGNKIGKSEGNVIGLTDLPTEFYAKIMSLGDEAILPCFTLLTDLSTENIEEIKQKMSGGENPMTYKKQLAFTLTTWLHSDADAKQAQEAFEGTFQKHQTPTNIPTFETDKTTWDLLDLLIATKLIESKSEGRRLIDQKAIEINGTVISKNESITLQHDDVIKIGKTRFVKIVI